MKLTKNDNNQMDFLAIDVFTFTPHLEASGEICIEQMAFNDGVCHCFINVENPDDTYSYNEWGYSKKYKVSQLHKVLKRKGVGVFYDNLPKPHAFSTDTDHFTENNNFTIEGLRALKYKGANLGIGVLSSIISKTKDSEPDLAALSDLVQLYLRSATEVYDRSIRLIKLYKPKKLLVFNGRLALCKAISEAAKDQGVEVVYHERGATIDRYQVVNMPIHDFKGIRSRRDQLWEQAEEGKEEVARDFFERRRSGDGIGWLSFIDHQQPNEKPEKTKARRLVYFSSSDDEYAAVEDGLEQKLFKSQRSAILWLIDWIGNQEDVALFIRIHPHVAQKSKGDQVWWSALSGKNVQVIPPNDITDSYALAESADIVVSFGSTMGVESTYWGVPSILIGDAMYSGLDCVYEPKNINDLRSLLETTDLPIKPKENCFSHGYYGLSFGVPYKYFKPEGLFLGTFFGERLTYESRFHQILRRSKQRKLFGKTGKS